MLEVRGVEAGYGSLQVLKGVELDVNKGEIATLIGANGAGKTTLLRAICGVIPVKRGQVLFQGEDIVGLPPHRIVKRGVFLVQEGRAILRRMTVLENLLMGGFVLPDKEIEHTLETVFSIFPILRQRERQLGETLSGGEQQMLALGRALMSKPRLLMLDEPSLGLAPKLVNEVFSKILELKGEEVGILLVEQNARKALQIADRGYVLETGKVVLAGTGQELRSNQRVQEAYLGGKRGERRP